MTYTQRKLAIPTNQNFHIHVTATEAIGTGLAYHKWEDGYYTITALTCGNYSPAKSCSCQEERVAQLFIDELCKLTDWTQEQSTIIAAMNTYSFQQWGVQDVIKDALERARGKYALEKSLQKVQDWPA